MRSSWLLAAIRTYIYIDMKKVFLFSAQPSTRSQARLGTAWHRTPPRTPAPLPPTRTRGPALGVCHLQATLRVQGSGSGGRVQGSGVRGQGSGVRVQGWDSLAPHPSAPGCPFTACPRRQPRAFARCLPFSSHAQGSGFRGQGSKVSAQGSGVRVKDSGFRVQASGFGAQGSGLKAQGPGLRFQGSGLRAQGSRVQGMYVFLM